MTRSLGQFFCAGDGTKTKSAARKRQIVLERGLRGWLKSLKVFLGKKLNNEIVQNQDPHQNMLNQNARVVFECEMPGPDCCREICK